MIASGEPNTRGQGRPPAFGMRPLNIGLLGAGLLSIAAGYVLLSRGSTVAAPLLLVLGYAVLVPAALLVGLRRSSDGRGEGE